MQSVTLASQQQTPPDIDPATLPLLTTENQLLDPLSSEALKFGLSTAIDGIQVSPYAIEAPWPLWKPGDDLERANSV